MQNLEQANPALKLIEKILDIMRLYQPQQNEMFNTRPTQIMEVQPKLEEEGDFQILTTRQDKMQSSLSEQLQYAVENFNQFYINMLDYTDPNPAKRNQLYKTLKNSSHILYEIQRYADPESFNSIPQWLSKVIECSCSKKRGQTILLISIGVFLKIIENKETKGNMRQLQELVKPQSKYSNQNYCMDIIKTLWSLLDDSSDHVLVVQLLKQFDIRLPRIFSVVVTAELSSKDRSVKYKAVNKFSIFWKLTAKDYPTYKPF